MSCACCDAWRKILHGFINNISCCDQSKPVDPEGPQDEPIGPQIMQQALGAVNTYVTERFAALTDDEIDDLLRKTMPSRKVGADQIAIFTK